MAGSADSKFSNQPITFESNQIGIVRFEFESNLEASQVRTYNGSKKYIKIISMNEQTKTKKQRNTSTQKVHLMFIMYYLE